MKVFFLDHNQVLADISKEFETVEDPAQADRIVVWADLTFQGRMLVDFGKSRGIPTIAVQHGRWGSSRYFPPFDEPITADKLLVWGQIDKDALVEAGHPEDKIKVVGTTILDHIKPKKQHSGIRVVFSPDHWDKEIDENKNVMEELKKVPNIQLSTKIIDGQDPNLYVNPVQSFRSKPDHLDIGTELLSKADLMVSISEGTYELLAEAMDVPVITVTDWEPKPFGGDNRYMQGYRRVVSSATKTTTLENLRKTIEQQLANPDELKEERRKAAVDNGINLDTTKLMKREILG